MNGVAPRERLDRLWRRGREFLGTRYAIMGGAMTWVSERHLVAAISNGGGFGVIASGSMGADALDLCDPDLDRAKRLAGSLSERFGRTVAAVTDPLAALGGASGAVNATPVGMEKYPGVPFDTGALTARHWVADIVYFPPETELLRRARALGCRTLAGTGMAIFQAIKAFELFTGLSADRESMTEHFEAAA